MRLAPVAVDKKAVSELELKKYVPSKTARRFHASKAFVRGIKGPVGSGKSVMCCMEVFSRALEMPPDKQGVRRSRWCFVRNTYGELLSTTLKTWQTWVPPQICPVSMSVPIQARMFIDLADGTKVDLEVLFLALDRAEDIDKLKSLELTGVWLNEASEIDRAVLNQATVRVGRYPQHSDVVTDGPIWKGIIMDTNPPDTEHWWYEMAEITKPDGYAFFNQPPALLWVGPPEEMHNPAGVSAMRHWIANPEAENIEHLPDKMAYYFRGLAGKPLEWIKVFILGEYGAVSKGKPVYPEFQDSVHVARSPILLDRKAPLYLGWDFGLNASCVFAQMSPKGQVLVLDEATSEEMGIQRFVREVIRPKLATKFPGMAFFGVGDPAGEARAQTTEQTCYQILADEGFNAVPAPTNEFVARREAVTYFMTRGAFLLDPACKVLREGFIKGYHYRRMRLAGVERYADVPDKNEYSHLHDALQYLCLYLKTFGANWGTMNGMPRGFSDPHRARPSRPISISAWT